MGQGLPGDLSSRGITDLTGFGAGQCSLGLVRPPVSWPALAWQRPRGEGVEMWGFGQGNSGEALVYDWLVQPMIWGFFYSVLIHPKWTSLVFAFYRFTDRCGPWAAGSWLCVFFVVF